MFHAEVEDMSEEERQDRALGFAKLTLGGKSELERAAVLHQNIGSRAMAEMMIETFEPCPGKPWCWKPLSRQLGNGNHKMSADKPCVK